MGWDPKNLWKIEGFKTPNLGSKKNPKNEGCRWWFQFFQIFVQPDLGKWSKLSNIFQMGWKRHLDIDIPCYLCKVSRCTLRITGIKLMGDSVGYMAWTCWESKKCSHRSMCRALEHVRSRGGRFAVSLKAVSVSVWEMDIQSTWWEPPSKQRHSKFEWRKWGFLATNKKHLYRFYDI